MSAKRFMKATACWESIHQVRLDLETLQFTYKYICKCTFPWMQCWGNFTIYKWPMLKSTQRLYIDILKNLHNTFKSTCNSQFLQFTDLKNNKQVNDFSLIPLRTRRNQYKKGWNPFDFKACDKPKNHRYIHKEPENKVLRQDLHVSTLSWSFIDTIPQWNYNRKDLNTRSGTYIFTVYWSCIDKLRQRKQKFDLRISHKLPENPSGQAQ